VKVNVAHCGLRFVQDRLKAFAVPLRLCVVCGLEFFSSLLGVFSITACQRDNPPPSPSFAALFPPDTGSLMTTSSPAFADLDADGIPDIVFGTGVDRTRPMGRRLQFTGEPAVSGEVVAVSGATNRVLWKVPNPRDAFTTPRFALLNKDRVPDVVMGGREGVLTAYDGTNGAVLWRLLGEDVVQTPFPYYFLTPAFIDDANGDGVLDLVDTYGGNDTRMPKEPRGPGHLMVISGADGKVIATREMRDSTESYASPVIYRRRDGAAWVIFGTGGESLGGAAYRAPVSSLLDGTFAARTERLVAPGDKGVIAPATVVELNADGELDIVVSTFDGRLVALDGVTGKPFWTNTDAREESYHSPAVVRLADGRLGLFLSRGIGAFPKYVGTVHRLYDAADGRVLWEYRDPNYPAGAPIAVDLTGDDVDEPLFFTTRFPAAQGARIHILHVPTRNLLSHDVPTNLWSTPAVADLRNTGTVELVALSWLTGTQGGTMARPDLSWQLLRLDLSAKTPAFRSWAGYMGSATDGQYHPPAR
jgi:outer membrane protein assembly factor BamB